MRLANVGGRLALIASDGLAVDVAQASAGLFEAGPQRIFDRWDDFRDWAASASLGRGEPFADDELGPPVPEPRQVFAIGMNYAAHADEVGVPKPEQPPVFTKFVTSIAGPYDAVEHPGGDLDWEVELVAVIGHRAHRVSADDAWQYVAGLTVGLDLSERRTQHNGPNPQYSLGKSFPGFGPIGPWLVTPEELADPDDLELGCLVNGEEVQRDSTRHMVFSVAELVARLSAVTPLLPGDLIFTGTPSGVGERRTPARFLSVGDQVVGYVEGIGDVRSRIVARIAVGS
jgi:2-keto-4-pentenoate hydratase/2-oxohepta-3-ene-1,7-dioic acid hydratase in catechol pathway